MSRATLQMLARIGWFAAAILMIQHPWLSAADDQTQQTPPPSQSSPYSASSTDFYSSGEAQPSNAQPGDVLPPEIPAPNAAVPNAMPGNVTPPGAEPARGPSDAQGFVAYKSIPESVLPRTSAPATETNQATPSVGVPATTNLGAPAINWGPYTLGPDDVVHIAVRNQPEFTGAYVIGHDGNIQFGFIGDITADGLTKEELARAVEERLRRYVRVPSVQVTIIGFNSKAIYILGRVARPGKYAMRGDSVKLRDAVIAAGLVVHHAKLRRVHIVKSDPANPSFRVIDLQRILYKGIMKENIDLVAGDIVVIPTTVWGGINDFLNELLSPAGHAGGVAALAAL